MPMSALITFKKNSFYFKNGEKTREVKNLTEVHYRYKSKFRRKQTAFESDIEHTGFTMFNSDIESVEIVCQ
jgi:hypothetical protein